MSVNECLRAHASISNCAKAALVANVVVAFDWDHLLQNQVGACHISAYVGVYQALVPMLRHTMWPDPVQRPDVERSWPTGRRAIVKQYVDFVGHVRCSGKMLPYKTSFWRIASFSVIAVMANADTLTLARLFPVLPDERRTAAVLGITSLIVCYARTAPFCIEANQLMAPGLKVNSRKESKDASRPRADCRRVYVT